MTKLMLFLIKKSADIHFKLIFIDIALVHNSKDLTNIKAKPKNKTTEKVSCISATSKELIFSLELLC